MSGVILAVLSAFLLSLSFSSFNLGIFAWVAFIPLLVALEKKSFLKSLAISYLWGVIFWSFTIYWLIHVTLLGQVILIFVLAFYFGIFGCLVYLFRNLTLKVYLFFIPSAWVLLEYARSYLFTGFPWAVLGLCQYQNLPLIQFADITGAWGVSFLVVLVNVMFYACWRKQVKVRILLPGLIILAVCLIYGYYNLARYSATPTNKPIKVTVIQGNISQDLKWDPGQIDFILNNYFKLTTESIKNDPQLIIWPEASVPGIFGEDKLVFEQVFSLARKLNTDLLVGAVSRQHEDYFNSALFIDKLGRPEKIYHKLHLVPFGEYVPLKEVFPFLQAFAVIGDIAPGKEFTIFTKPDNFGVLICFEDLFPELSRQYMNQGAKFLVNITNDAWYKEGSAPYQHFSASVLRAVENRTYLARAANTGISGFVHPTGKILQVVQDTSNKKIFINGAVSQNIYPVTKKSFYSIFGDLFILFCLLFDSCVIISILIKRIK
ncbi:MAG: apolipoprotein N-acyltransferase [Candidatus Omnitrophica bacterium]|nr:apolipoprotein N-acyltransferase [Candidatus Omnitrophota bacterium]